MPDDRYFLGPAARFAATECWGESGLVCFSCHGYGDEQFAPRSHLRLADDLLMAHDVVYRRPPLKEGALVVLNGCQTSVPDLAPAEASRFASSLVLSMLAWATRL